LCDGEFLKQALDAILLDDRQRGTVHTSGPAVPFHSPPRLLEDVIPPDPIHQGVEAPFRGSLGRDPESALPLAHVVDGRVPTPPVVERQELPGLVGDPDHQQVPGLGVVPEGPPPRFRAGNPQKVRDLRKRVGRQVSWIDSTVDLAHREDLAAVCVSSPDGDGNKSPIEP